MRVIVTAGLLIAGTALAFAMPHGRPGLWSISTTMQMADMPPIPPEAMAMMKARGIKMPGMDGEPVVNRICMTDQDVKEGAAALQRMRQQHDVDCTPRVLSESAGAVTTEITCHGAMEGVGRSQITWQGDSRYEGSYNFKGTMHGRPSSISTHYVGSFVKSDCGDVKPFRAGDMKDVPARAPSR